MEKEKKKEEMEKEEKNIKKKKFKLKYIIIGLIVILVSIYALRNLIVTSKPYRQSLVEKTPVISRYTIWADTKVGGSAFFNEKYKDKYYIISVLSWSKDNNYFYATDSYAMDYKFKIYMPKNDLKKINTDASNNYFILGKIEKEDFSGNIVIKDAFIIDDYTTGKLNFSNEEIKKMAENYENSEHSIKYVLREYYKYLDKFDTDDEFYKTIIGNWKVRTSISSNAEYNFNDNNSFQITENEKTTERSYSIKDGVLTLNGSVYEVRKSPNNDVLILYSRNENNPLSVVGITSEMVLYKE